MAPKVRSKKLFLGVRDERFTDRRQSSVISVLTDGSEIYLNQYGKMFIQDELGNFDINKVGDQAVLEFFPIDGRTNDYSYSFISYDTKQNILNFDSYTFGNTVKVTTNNVNIGASTTEKSICGVNTQFTSTKFLVEISSISGNNYEYNEINLVTNGSDISSSEFGRITISDNSYYNQTGIGTYGISSSGSDLNLIFYPNISEEFNCNVVAVSLANTNFSSVASRPLRYADVKSVRTSIASSSAPTPQVISSYTSNYNLGYFIIQITDTTNNEIQLSELVVLNSDTESTIIGYGNVYTNSSLGTFDVGTTSLTELFFTANPDIDVSINILQHAVSYIEFSSFPTSINFKNAELTTGVSKFDDSSDFAFKKDFNLNHKLIPIFERSFNGSLESSPTNLSSVNLDRNLIYLPNHFFASGEKVNYKLESVDFVNILTTQTLSTVGVGTNILQVASIVGLNTGDYLNYGEYKLITNINSNLVSLSSTIGSQIGIGSTVVFSRLQSSGAVTASTIGAIGISQTYISGVGNTDKLSGDLYVYKYDKSFIGLCTSPLDALSSPPKLIDFTSVGIGNNHYITSTNQNSKCMILIDNVIQSPIVSTAVTSRLEDDLELIDTTVAFSGITSFFGGNLIKINDEIMKISSVGVGSTTFVEVQRPLMGTTLQTHSVGSTIIKLEGNYNIVGNKVYFASAPYGPIYDNVKGDINIRSTFQGRVFLRSGIPGLNKETYQENYVFDDIKSKFDAKTKDFTLKSNNQDISGFSTSNAVILINNIFQSPENDYDLTEATSQTSLNFTGAATSVAYDPNNASIPRGKIITSIASSNGFGYQPLISAGGTAIVSTAGTIQSISIGNSGSGYRSIINSTIRVGVQTLSTGTPNIQYIGTASVSNGHIVSIAITNPGTGYTSTNPPDVVFDPPLSYSNLDLVYYGTNTGLGTEAKIDIVVGQGSSVIDFKINNYGYSYNIGDQLTIVSGGSSGIPTDTTKIFSPFIITVERTFTDNFSGWSLGQLQKLDDIDSLFNGLRKSFPLIDDGNRFSIITKKGSDIDLKSVLLIFVNDVLQEPDVAYTFNGGSNITFTEAPKSGDKCRILFYKGTPGIDVVDIDILETIKTGDTLKIVGDTEKLIENERLVRDIILPDTVETNPYNSVGVTSDLTLQRPVVWCKQTNDTVVDGVEINKNRIQYEPNIFPVSKLIKSVGVGSTQIFVDSVKSMFDTENENTTNAVINKIEIIDTSNLVQAIATAIVSTAGTIQSISIVESGVGYSTNPIVSIQNPIGVGSTGKSVLVSSISSGSVNSISVTSPGFGYTFTNPPLVLIGPPTAKRQYVSGVTYSGDYGIISGIKTTNVGFASTGLVFDLYIPQNSYLRNSAVTDPIIIQSQILENYYFKVSNSKIGSGVTSLSKNGSVIGVGTTGIDNVYQVISVSSASTDVYGVGNATVTRVVVSVNSYNGISGFGYSAYYGDYSWGLITVSGIEEEFNVGTGYGVVGLNSTPTVRRYNSLRIQNYNSI